MIKNCIRKSKQIDFIKCQRYFVRSNAVHTQDQNIDHENMEHFTKMKERWWHTDGPMRGLHTLNTLRVPFIRDGLINTKRIKSEQKFTCQPLKDLKLLEVGCGGGILTEPLARIGANITGLDANEELVALAEEHRIKAKNLNNITYTVNTIEEYSIENREQFDAVVVSEVLEHIIDKDSFIQACVRTLKPEGSIFITTLGKNFISWLCAIIIAERVLNVVPQNSHNWELFIQPHETQRLLEIYNCSTLKVHGMFYNVYNDNWSWCSRTDISYALHAIKNVIEDDKEIYHE